MNYFKTLFCSAALLSSSVIFAQNEVTAVKDVAKFTTTKKYTTTLNGKKTVYRIKVMESREYPVKLDPTDSNLKEQNRIYTPAYVTKKVYIDDDSDKYYDKSMVIRYMKSYEDKFEIIPMKNGNAVGIKVDGMDAEEISKAGYYLTDTEDNDYFVVEEFNSL